MKRSEGGFRCAWLARLTHGRLGLGRWTHTELDLIHARAKAQAEEFHKSLD